MVLTFRQLIFQTIILSVYRARMGHGKSALLDAITWALWGQARKTFGTTKADQGLLRLGQTQMFVMLDFEFNGQTYRVRREFAKTYGKPYAALDFGILNPQSNELHPLTDKTIRQTQHKIESLLNLDIESFVNSAFLRQGQSNEFSKKTAKERKNVLATILGLNRYETLRALALEKVKDAYAQKDSIIAIQSKIEQELAHKPALMHQIATSTADLNTIMQQETNNAHEQAQLEKLRIQLNDDHNKQTMLLFKLNQLEADEQAHRQSVRSLLTAWRTTNKKLRQLNGQQQLENDKRLVMQEISDHQAALQKSLELKEKHLNTQQELHTIQKQVQERIQAAITHKKLHVERLILEKNALETNAAETTKLLQTLNQDYTNHKHELIALQKTVLEHAEHLLTHAAYEKQFERRKDYYQKFIAQGTWIKQELDNLEQKNKLVHDDDNPSCPLCEQNLSANRKRFLKKRFEGDAHWLNHRLQRLKKITITLKALLLEQHAQLAKLKKNNDEINRVSITIQERVKQQTSLESTIHQTTTTLEQITKTIGAHTAILMAAQQELAALIAQEQHELLADAMYQAALQKVTAVETEGKAIAYDAGKHQQATTRLQLIEQQLHDCATISQQASAQAQRQATIQDLCMRLKKSSHEKKELQISLLSYTSLPERRKKLDHHEQELIKKNSELRQAKELLLQEKGRLENQQHKLQQLEKEQETYAALLKTIDTQISDYHAIATATGKDGIQALLIEEAIPEIEQEANQLLAKLTNNQAQIFIESLRDLKSGGTKETLDIKISDAIGIRPYEMFSGGEAFRIDFALRIAISKLLARRAGTSLQTLIIDEGFGSQDEEGLGHIMDALYTIQEDFSKVIIVSHLPTMKDQFPVHFLIEKGANGSQVRVMEQG